MYTFSTAAAFLVSVGCGHDPNAGLHSKAAIVVAIDASVPGQSGRQWQSDELASIEKSASEAHYLFDLWSYSGASVRHLWGPSQPLDQDQTAPASGVALAPVSAAAPRLSEPGTLLTAINAERVVSSLPAGRILIITDGFVSPNGWRELRAGLAPFADRPGWRIEVLGISARFEPAWKKALGSAMGNRYELVSEQDATRFLKENTDE